MDFLLLLVVIAVIAAVLFVVVKAKKGGGAGEAPWPFYAKKAKALGSAGIRIVRWQARSIPDEATIKAAFAHAQQGDPADSPASASLR
ncbi:MAG: hypothetical protein M0Q23_03220 [Syntrophales bacterium]|jgi:hypothetical protein|nr:hypothetical protein [Syntrophales bacterium]MCK9527656.1 hypothetical protein [Syntrophales bacterium]MDX9922274.1 hypothetical protein [Syntrophales bacterium]